MALADCRLESSVRRPLARPACWARCSHRRVGWAWYGSHAASCADELALDVYTTACAHLFLGRRFPNGTVRGCRFHAFLRDALSGHLSVSATSAACSRARRLDR